MLLREKGGGGWSSYIIGECTWAMIINMEQKIRMISIAQRNGKIYYDEHRQRNDKGAETRT